MDRTKAAQLIAETLNLIELEGDLLQDVFRRQDGAKFFNLLFRARIHFDDPLAFLRRAVVEVGLEPSR
jgi:hypothetical protein